MFFYLKRKNKKAVASIKREREVRHNKGKFSELGTNCDTKWRLCEYAALWQLIASMQIRKKGNLLKLKISNEFSVINRLNKHCPINLFLVFT